MPKAQALRQPRNNLGDREKKKAMVLGKLEKQHTHSEWEQTDKIMLERQNGPRLIRPD